MIEELSGFIAQAIDKNKRICMHWVSFTPPQHRFYNSEEE